MEAKITGSQLNLILSVGVSRDFLPSWSMAAEIASRVSATDSCLGFDLTTGCMGVLVGLVTASGWLASTGGYAAIVCAERWSHTIDHGNRASAAVWAHSDGAAAIVVAVDRPATTLARFDRVAFTTHTEFNGLVLVRYGGTRFPVPPPDQSPFTRQIAPIPASAIWAVYEANYRRAFSTLAADVRFERVLCNQISPNVVAMIAASAQVDVAQAVVTGDQYGHVGGADVLIGMRALLDRGELTGPVALAASVPHAVGAGILLPAA
jgi:3-oxoacyl-[acyl-carrier-protein] synthase III